MGERRGEENEEKFEDPIVFEYLLNC